MGIHMRVRVYVHTCDPLRKHACTVVARTCTQRHVHVCFLYKHACSHPLSEVVLRLHVQDTCVLLGFKRAVIYLLALACERVLTLLSAPAAAGACVAGGW